MNDLEFDILRSTVLNALHYGACEQALGMLQGAGIVADVSSHMAEWEQLYSWVFMAGSCAIDRQFDNQQRQEWHETQVSLEESVR
jgi:hypothetical protein